MVHLALAYCETVLRYGILPRNRRDVAHMQIIKDHVPDFLFTTLCGRLGQNAQGWWVLVRPMVAATGSHFSPNFRNLLEGSSSVFCSFITFLFINRNLIFLDICKFQKYSCFWTLLKNQNCSCLEAFFAKLLKCLHYSKKYKFHTF